MAREKQHVFSARTTEEGLKALNEVKTRLKVGWDELVIEAVSAHYGLDRAVMALPKKEAPAKPEQGEEKQPPSEKSAAEQPVATEREQPAEKPPAKKGGKRGGKASKAKQNLGAGRRLREGRKRKGPPFRTGQ